MIEFLLVPICFFIDRYTKAKAETSLSKVFVKKISNNNVYLKLVYNEGAFLGILKKHKKCLMLFNIISLIALTIMCLTVFLQKGLYIMKLGLSILIGGALGNLYDRASRGRVIDFFAFKIKPNLYFNLADMFVFLGSALVLISSAIKSNDF
jgi:signal peptidase II